ncbi:MAG: JAB domain-containing protein [Planctomycetota bacterium]
MGSPAGPGAGLPWLSRASPLELRRAQGWSPEAAARVWAAFELGRRAEGARLPPRSVITGAAGAASLLAPLLRGRRQECLALGLLDARHRLLSTLLVGQGTLDRSLVHPREIFGPALREGAAAVLCAHNHPSGDPEPSAQDWAVTRRLRSAGELLGVPLLDHLVFGAGCWVSLRARDPDGLFAGPGASGGVGSSGWEGPAPGPGKVP